MKIGIAGEMRFPVIPRGPGGLGRTTHMLAAGLLDLGHDVTLYAPRGSEFGGRLEYGTPDPRPFDAFVDFTHEHDLSRAFPGAPIENLIGDRECPYCPPCAVIETRYMQKHYQGARLVPASVDVGNIPVGAGGDYLVFMALMHPFKGVTDAVTVGKKTGVRVVFVGPGGEGLNLPEYRGVITDDAEKWALIGGALGVLCPYYRDAAPRTPLEAAACGTPTLCHSQDGTREHVAQGVTGYAGLNAWDMADNVRKLAGLDRAAVRKWVKENHDLPASIRQHERILQAIVSGERW